MLRGQARPPFDGGCVNGTALPPREAKWRSKMTMMSSAASRPAFAGRAAGSVRTIGTRMQAILSYFHRRAAIKALSELDDRALRDIGLTRCMIEPAAKGELDPERVRLR